MILDGAYIALKNQVIKAERRILKELGFCVHVKHPHKVYPLQCDLDFCIYFTSFFQLSSPLGSIICGARLDLTLVGTLFRSSSCTSGG